jgi:hypothetical protein
MQYQEIAAKLAFGNIPNNMIFEGKIMQRIGASAVTFVGGSADDWNKLSYLQRVNFIAISSGTLVEVLIGKYIEDTPINS